MQAQVLKLTGIIKRGDSPGVFVGAIKEISGIIAQGHSVDEVYANLIEGTRGMLEFKRAEALELLAEQLQGDKRIKENASLDFSLDKRLELA